MLIYKSAIMFYALTCTNLMTVHVSSPIVTRSSNPASREEPVRVTMVPPASGPRLGVIPFKFGSYSKVTRYFTGLVYCLVFCLDFNIIFTTFSDLV